MRSASFAEASSGAGAIRRRTLVVDEVVLGQADAWEDAGTIPRSFLDDVVAAEGWWGAVLPPELGGRGLDTRELGDLHEEVGRGSSSLRSLLTVHTMVGHVIDKFGTSMQRETWLPSLASGQVLASFCLSEPNAGSDAAAIESSAEMIPGGWRLNGTKTWITGGFIADLYLVFARVADGVGAFLVPRSTRGLEVCHLTDVLGTRGSAMARIALEGVEVGTDALVGPEGFASSFVRNSALDLGRFSVAAGSAGIIRGCLEASLGYARARRAGDSVLQDHQFTKQKIADMTTALAAARALRDVAAHKRDTGDPGFGRASWLAKYYSASAAVAAASDAVQLHGAVGCTSLYPVARHYRDAKVMEIIEGSNEVQRLVISGFAHQEVSRS